MEMQIVFWVIVGILAGGISQTVVPGKSLGGPLGDLALGLMGALLGGWLFTVALGHPPHGWILSASAATALASAVLLLVLGRAAIRPRVVVVEARKGRYR